MPEFSEFVITVGVDAHPLKKRVHENNMQRGGSVRCAILWPRLYRRYQNVHAAFSSRVRVQLFIFSIM